MIDKEMNERWNAWMDDLLEQYQIFKDKEEVCHTSLPPLASTCGFLLEFCSYRFEGGHSVECTAHNSFSCSINGSRSNVEECSLKRALN